MRRIFLASALFLTAHMFAGQVTVTNANDSGPGSLRQAILDVGACPKPCHVMFAIAGSPPRGHWRIEPLTPLPVIYAGSIHIDGRTQTTYGGDTNPQGPEVVLSGAQAGMATGLVFQRAVGGPHPHGDYSIRGLGFEHWQQAAASFSGSIGLGFQPLRLSRITIADNYFGLDGQGGYAAPNRTAIWMQLVDDVVVANNVISGNGEGVSISGGSRVRVEGNNIGLNATKTRTLGNVSAGLRFRGVNDSMVERNSFAGHRAAVTVEAGAVARGNTIYRNEMFDNTFGIDLQNDGATPNDPTDSDSGPNDLQNYPVMRLSGRVLRGELDSTPQSGFDVDIYENDMASGNQGRRYLGTIAVTTDATGLAPFSFMVPRGSGPYYTATATSHSTRSTSEFCEPVN